MENEVSPPGSWTRRRRYLYAVTAFTMGAIGFSLWKGDGAVYETTVSMGFTALMAFVGAYVFGAVWDDSNARKMK